MSSNHGESIDIAKLRSFKYAELRAFAKAMDIKLGNVKAEKYISAILEKLRNVSDDSETDTENAFVVLNKSQAKENPSKPEESHETTQQNLSQQVNSIVATETDNSVPRARRIRRNTYDATPDRNGITVPVSNEMDQEAKENTPKTPARKLRSKVLVSSVTKSTVKSATKKVKVAKDASAVIKKSHLPLPLQKRNCFTPNFKKIHLRQFEKMDSIDVYVQKKKQRKEWLEALHHKSIKNVRTLRCKTFNPQQQSQPDKVFEPTVMSTTKMNTNFVANASSHQASTQSAKSPFRFGLSAKRTAIKRTATNREVVKVKPSSKRKLNYVPYTGPVAPLCIDTGFGSFSKCDTSVLLTATKTASHKQSSFGQSPGQRCRMLEGVRRNKRFNLQLQFRGIVDNE